MNCVTSLSDHGFVICVLFKTRYLPISIVEGQCGGKAGCGHAGLDCRGNNVAPGRLGAVDGIPEEVVQQEVCLKKTNAINVYILEDVLSF